MIKKKLSLIEMHLTNELRDKVTIQKTLSEPESSRIKSQYVEGGKSLYTDF